MIEQDMQLRLIPHDDELFAYFVNACAAEIPGAGEIWSAALERKLQVLYPGARVRPQSALEVHGIDRRACYVFRDRGLSQPRDDQ